MDTILRRICQNGYPLPPPSHARVPAEPQSGPTNSFGRCKCWVLILADRGWPGVRGVKGIPICLDFLDAGERIPGRQFELPGLGVRTQDAQAGDDGSRTAAGEAVAGSAVAAVQVAGRADIAHSFGKALALVAHHDQGPFGTAGDIVGAPGAAQPGPGWAVVV